MAQTTREASSAPLPEPVAPGPSGLATAVRRLCRWSPALAAIVLVGYAVRAGMPAGHVLLATLVLLVIQVLPGALVWRSVRPRRGWLTEDLTMGFAIGSALAIGAQVVAGLARLPWLSYTPLLVGLVLVLVPATRARILEARTRPLPWLWGPPVAALMLVTIQQLRGFFRVEPLSWASGVRAPYVDAYLHLALAGQLAHRGPTTFPWVQSEPLGYHWFSHAWVAQVSVASGAGLDEVLFRFMPVVMPVVVVLSVAIAAVRLTGVYWTGPVAAALTMIGGDLSIFGRPSAGLPINPLSPSLALGAPMLVGLVVVLALRWRGATLPGASALVPVLSIGAAGTKGSTVPLIAAGLGLALVAMLLFSRARVRAVLVDLLIVGACLIFAVVVVFHGSEAGLHFSLTDAADQTGMATRLGNPSSAWQVLFVLAVTFSAVIARGVGAWVLPFTRAGRRRPLTWLLIGGGFAAAAAVATLAHPGRSQFYFARSGEPLLALGSALGLVAIVRGTRPALRVPIFALGALSGLLLVELPPALLDPVTRGSWRRAAAMIIVAALVLGAAGAVVWLAGAGLGRADRLRLAGATLVLAVLAGGVFSTWTVYVQPSAAPLGAVPITSDRATSREQIEAARWIRAHSGVDDLVMTNRHCTTPVEPYNCDSRRFVVSAFSERQVLLEGWTATPMSARLGPNGRDSITVSYWHPDLLKLNDDFIAHPTAEAARQLREKGVRWIYVDHTRPYAATLEPYATLRYQNRDVDVYELEKK